MMRTNIQMGDTAQSAAIKFPEAAGTTIHRHNDTVGRAVFDKVFAALALLFFAPFLVVVALTILITDGRPVFFRHHRIGRDGKVFGCLKFRTMVVDANEQLERLLASCPKARAEWEANQKLDDDPRITRLGEFLRKTSLDELPQFWNVLKGDMAIVGPRPIVRSEMARYGDHINDYMSVRPGITGSWQVNGRSLTTYEQRVRMDLEYIHNRSFVGDLAIIAKTIKVVLLGSGAR